MKFPKVIFGTSGLGNLYVELSDAEKLAIVQECVTHSAVPAIFDSAGKYGAGLALEALGKCLAQLNVARDKVLISNKLGWYRTALTTAEPQFEPGVWKNLRYDAVQKISYQGILDCYEQGNDLLNGYTARLVSVHDPDEYLQAAANESDRQKIFSDIVDAYSALAELKAKGKVDAVGIGSKDWKIIQQIAKEIKLDWVMIANCMTIHDHPAELVLFMKELESQGVAIINSAVFNGGFLMGSDYYNYKQVNPEQDNLLYKWRSLFFETCSEFNIRPVEACVKFGLAAPGVQSVALNTTNATRVKENIKMPDATIPHSFWKALVNKELIQDQFYGEYLRP